MYRSRTAAPQQNVPLPSRGGTSMNPINRRQFSKSAMAASVALSARRGWGANDRIRIGFIGLGNRGDQVLDAFLQHKDADIIAVCDIYQPYLDFAAEKIRNQNGNSPDQYHDYRKLLERNDIDAVVICT